MRNCQVNVCLLNASSSIWPSATPTSPNAGRRLNSCSRKWRRCRNKRVSKTPVRLNASEKRTMIFTNFRSYCPRGTRTLTTSERTKWRGRVSCILRSASTWAASVHQLPSHSCLSEH
ncbi:unnamed protein product, partial [Timema podura]|nr:unnamed protein product [Timema podura]